MTGTWFTSDSHFDHKLVAEIRGFYDTEEHDQAIIKSWNATVKPEDTVWHLGDVGMGKLSRFAHRIPCLNGTIHLVTGNHDTVSPIHRGAHRKQREWLEVFASVQPFARLRIEGTQVLLSHYPYSGDHTEEERYTQYRLPDEGLWLLHGHTHDSERIRPERPRQIHVGLDAWNLHPVPMSSIIAHIKMGDKIWDMRR